MLMSSLLFFFKQKTAYEMRISDWSSDVCSSDLVLHHPHIRGEHAGVEFRLVVYAAATIDISGGKPPFHDGRHLFPARGIEIERLPLGQSMQRAHHERHAGPPEGSPVVFEAHPPGPYAPEPGPPPTHDRNNNAGRCFRRVRPHKTHQ